MASVWTYPEEENFSSRSFPRGPSARYPQVSLSTRPQLKEQRCGRVCLPMGQSVPLEWTVGSESHKGRQVLE